MKRRLLLASVATLTACGGAATPVPTSNEGFAPPAASPADALWAAVAKPGASFTFDDYLPEVMESKDDATVVVATVSDVKPVEGGQAIFIQWTERGDEMMSNIPSVVVITAANVTFYPSVQDYEDMTTESALVFPAATEPVKLAGGLYIDPAVYLPGHEDDPERCYGWGPEEDDGECDDVCYAHLCVDPKLGLTGGEGRWWPGYGMFQRTDLR